MKYNPYYNLFFTEHKKPITNNIVAFLKKNHPLNRTVLFLIICYLVYLLTQLYMHLFAIPFRIGEENVRFFEKYLVLSAKPDTVIEMPWTIVTHFLLHTHFFSLIFYIFILVIFGKLFFQYWSGIRFFLLLFTAVYVGAGSFVCFNLIIPPAKDTAYTEVLNGAGASVFALMMYMFAYLPEYKFRLLLFAQIKIKYVVFLVIGLNFLFYKSGMQIIYLSYACAALFGAAFAVLSKVFQKKYTFIPNIKRKQKQTPTVNQYRTKTDEEYNMLKQQRQDKLDKILEKISHSGYSSLTKEEKDFLFFESQR